MKKPKQTLPKLTAKGKSVGAKLASLANPVPTSKVKKQKGNGKNAS